jgi:hypothetical protein
MSGALHWEFYEDFQTCLNLKIEICSGKNIVSQIFAIKDLATQEEKRKPIFHEGFHAVNDIP